jgi:hypothetical protein
MRRIQGLAVGVIAAAVVAGVMACGDSGTGVGTKIDLTGNYVLDQLLLGGFLAAPGSTGTLAATTDSVHANITIVSPNTTIIPDTTLTLAGSYLARHTSAKDSIYIVINGLGTIPGTFSISGAAKDTLTLGLITPGGAFTAIWHKT